MSQKVNVGILGATGTVGQRFIALLENHPIFEIKAIGASSRSAGRIYSECTERTWKMTTEIPENIKNMTIVPCEPEHFKGCRLIFSGLDAAVAGEIETNFANAGYAVFSNAKNHRMNPLVPLLVPLCNTEHFDVIKYQQEKYGYKTGMIVTNANCASTGLVVVLKALQNAFGPITKVMVHTLQAISGAGYPGVPSLDIIDNVVPFIGGEEEKVESEALKMLGGINAETHEFEHLTNMKISAHCNRVPVVDGHVTNLSIEFEKKPAPSVEEVKKVLREYTCEAQSLKCPSAPKECIIVKDAPDRPQPRLDRNRYGGMAVTVGRVRECPLFDIKLSLLIHNTILGAAGSSILNAEVAVAKGIF
ncbi:putative aspartate semialdehyde dehydrogenase [Anaeromyces robustus]|jgi:aspartate-semialdehyde dehydrogenase|uniref:Aspartate-semialdehyde dehydrogenase n=1 Tax=Anaeromyces robustus TaxID=1754192 RepID=A0A1Y1WQ17_9FUNG|nr:putative aspartate semialdehyde dehydrogenase [Anaeromyces robustus]|eukprot:ORX75475.1 putative aspartate semialdehyde dehydrogenase [Anaeromyces robustus]